MRKHLKVNISQKVRPFCETCIQIIKSIISENTPLVDVFEETMSMEGRVPIFFPTFLILNKISYFNQCNEMFLRLMLQYTSELFVLMPSIDY